MAKPKGHKRGCKCVACSPATRKKGQAALAKMRGGSSTRSNPSSGSRKKSSTSRKKSSSTRSNPAPAPAAAETNPTRRGGMTMPAEVFERAGYLVFTGSKGRRSTSCRWYRTKTEAVAQARRQSSGHAVVVAVIGAAKD